MEKKKRKDTVDDKKEKKTEKAEKTEKTEKTEKIKKTDKPEKTEKTDKTESIEKTEDTTEVHDAQTEKQGKSSRATKLAAAIFLAIGLCVYAIIDPAGFMAAFESVSFGEAPEPGDLEVYFLDVGQGDSIFLRSPSGKTMLIDASESKYFDAIDAFLKEQGVERLDIVVATHPHNDHIGAMAKVIDAYDIGVFYLSPVTHTTTTYERMLDALDKKGIATVALYADKLDELSWDDKVSVRVLSPYEGQQYDMNNWSVVLSVVYGDTSVLLTGDAEAYAESIMLEKVPAEYLKATVMKLGHHGSNTSTSEAFWAAVAPEAVVIQVGKGNDYGHPDKETLKLLKKWGGPVYRTDKNGAVHFTLDGKDYTVVSER